VDKIESRTAKIKPRMKLSNILKLPCYLAVFFPTSLFFCPGWPVAVLRQKMPLRSGSPGGKIHGEAISVDGTTVRIFRGIPFAAPP